MKKRILTALLCALLLLTLCACSNPQEYTDKCRSAFEALAEMENLHFTSVEASGIAGTDYRYITRNEFWFCGQDYLYRTNMDNVFDAAATEVCKDGNAFEYAWGQWEPAKLNSFPRLPWKFYEWDALKLAFKSAKNTDGKETVIFTSTEYSLEVVFCFNASGKLESFSMNWVGEHGPWQDQYTFISLDYSSIRETIDKAYASVTVE